MDRLFGVFVVTIEQHIEMFIKNRLT